MFIYTETGAVELMRNLTSEGASAYEAEVEIPVTSGESILAEYHLDYNFLEDATIGGTVVSKLPGLDGCQATRFVTAEHIRP